jgi:magnesium transporter
MEFFRVSPQGIQAFDPGGEGLSPLLAKEYVWIDLIYSEVHQLNQQLAQLGQSGLGLSGLPNLLAEHLNDASNRQHPSFFDSTSDYEMVVFRGLAMHPSNLENKKTFTLETRPTTFFFMQQIVVMVHAQSSRTVGKLKERFFRAEGDADIHLPATPEEFMVRVLNEMVDRFMDLRDPLGQLLESAQFDLLDTSKPFRDWLSLLRWRVELQKLEGMCEEQLDAVQEFLDARLDRKTSVCGGEAISDGLNVRLNNVIEHINRVLNHARRLELSIETAVQMHFSATAHRSTEIMRVLTVTTVIFMPLSLIAGIFGMNFEFIPGIKNQLGFWWALSIMGSVALGMFVWFRSRKWINTRRSRAAYLETKSVGDRTSRLGNYGSDSRSKQSHTYD